MGAGAQGKAVPSARPEIERNRRERLGVVAYAMVGTAIALVILAVVRFA